jgi:uncharacterized protein YndB with AHSA1/START domain
VADLGHPFSASYVLTGSPPEKVFAALLRVHEFPEWALGLSRSRALDEAGRETNVRPGATLELILSAAGLTHRVTSIITVVETPRRLEWRYTEGAEGTGGWLIEELGEHAVRLTLSTDYQVRPAWLNKLAHRSFFRGIIEDLLARSVRRFERHLE